MMANNMNNYSRVSNIYGNGITMNVRDPTEDASRMIGNSFDPEMFGPSLWFTLHNGAMAYPNEPTDFIRNGMTNLLINLPLLVPCMNCREHLYSFLKSTNLSQVVASRNNLFSFLVNVHNYVNKRYGKRTMTLDEAKLFYGYDRPRGGNIMKITYS